MRLFISALLVLAIVPAAAAGAPAKHAPNRPPLATSGAGTSTGSPAEEASASAPVTGGDPLASNGLNSPLCRDAAGELTGASARNCRASGFEGAQAPTGDYGLDVHIDTGLTHFGFGNVTSIIVETLLQVWWTALVAVVRGVIVILDWCFTIDLLNSPAMNGVARGLRETQATFTKPWLAAVLAIAAVGALYHGLIRRRVAHTLGEALLMVAMMAGGLWVIMNPTGTIGALGAWANEASLGALAAVGSGSTAHPNRTLAESDREVFGLAIDAPWCFMEFGDVGWCDAHAEPRLRKAAQQLAAQARAGGEGHAGGESIPSKAIGLSIKLIELGVGAPSGGGGETPHVSLRSAALLRAAHTNGELFLALPANGAARNSISAPGSLFQVLCGSQEEPCRGPTAGEAEFRTASGTWSRGIGLVLVAFGVLGMLLLLGFIAWRLLHAAFMSLIYLLLTPIAVLAPALGESGRSAFRTWAMRLLAAITSKLLYSLLLGAVLMVQRVLADIREFGWLTQWLLLSSLWWNVYLRRHRLFELATGANRGGTSGAQQRSVLRRVSDVLESRKGVAATRWAKRRLSKPAPSVDPRPGTERAAHEQAQAGMDEQVTRSLEHEHRDANAIAEAAPEIQERLADKRAQLKRIQSEQARASGDRRRTIELGDRGQRVAGEIASEERSLNTASRVARDGRQIQDMTGNVYSREQAREQERFLDAQAALPSTVQRRVHGANGAERDYGRLASLLDHGQDHFERLDPPGKRAARLKLDRELETRQRLAGVVAKGEGDVGSNAHEQRAADTERDPRQRQPPWVKGQRGPGSKDGSQTHGPGHEQTIAVDAHVRRRRSSVLDDAREAEARRKRQLGQGRR
jgi:hypothetical protein